MDGPADGQEQDVTAGLASRRDGDRAAPPLRLDAVYREHAEFVWRMTRRLGCPDEAVDDVVHDVFLVVRRRLADFDPSRALRPWLYGIARRVVADLRRGRRRADGRLKLVPVPAPAPDPEAQTERARAADFVRSFLGTLPAEQRVVFVMVELEGMTAPEVAEAVGAEVATVYSRLRLSREKFERAVERRAARARRGGAP